MKSDYYNPGEIYTKHWAGIKGLRIRSSEFVDTKPIRNPRTGEHLMANIFKITLTNNETFKSIEYFPTRD